MRHLGELACGGALLLMAGWSSYARAADMLVSPPTVNGAVSTPPATQPAVPLEVPPLPVLSVEAAQSEADRLLRLLRAQVPHFDPYLPQTRDRWVRLAREQIGNSDFRIDRPQLVMVVDRNPGVQALCFVLAFPGDTPWRVLGGTRVSTGQSGRKYYYITPVGVFENSSDRLGYRAEGTKNENGIRGIGAKGMRVWDMGWQWAEKGWLPTHEKGQIRLEIHATDPDFLERRLGHPASEGCVRIPAAMNKFIDHFGLLDVEYQQASSYDIRFRALLPRDREPTPIAGDLVIVVDSAQTSTT